MGQLNAVAISQLFQIFGKFLGARHHGAPDQHRDDRDFTPQGCAHFYSDKIGGIVQSPPSAFVFRGDPRRADNNQQNTAIGNALFDGFAEIGAGFDAGHIHEDFLLAEVGNQIVEQTSGLALCIAPPVTDEDRAQISTPPNGKNLLSAAETSPAL